MSTTSLGQPRQGSTGSVGSSPGSPQVRSQLGAMPVAFSGAKVSHSQPTSKVAIPGSAPAVSRLSVVSAADATVSPKPSIDASEDPKPMSALGRLFPLSEQSGTGGPPCFISDVVLQKELKKESESMSERWTQEMTKFSSGIQQQMARHEEMVDKRITEALTKFSQDNSIVIAEMRKDISVHRSQGTITDIDGLRHQESNAPRAAAPDSAALQQLRAELDACRMEQRSKFGDLEDLFEQQRALADSQRTTLQYSEAAIADLRSETQSLRDAHMVQSEASPGLQDIRREITEMQQRMSQGFQDVDSRLSSDVSRCAEDFANLVEATKASLKADFQVELQKMQAKRAADGGSKTVELSQAVEKLRSDIVVDLSQADSKASKCETSLKDLQSRVEELVRISDERMVREKGQHEEVTVRIQALQQGFEQDQLERTKEVALMSTRMEEVTQMKARLNTVEDSCRSIPVNPGQRQEREPDPPPADVAGIDITARLHALERNVTAHQPTIANATEELVTLNARLDILEVSCRDTVTLAVQRVEAALGLGAQPDQSSNSLAARLVKLEGQFSDFLKDQPPRLSLGSLDGGSKENLSSPVTAQAAAAEAVNRAASRRAALSLKMEAMLPEGSLAPDKVKDPVAAASELRSFVASGLAQCMGEMDAELWMEVSGQIQTLGGQLRSDILSEVDKRIDSAQASGTMAAEVKRFVTEIGSKVGKIESVVNEVAGHRMIATEGEVKKLQLLVAALMDRSDQVNTSALLAQAEELTTGTLGTPFTSKSGPVSDSSASHRPPFSDDGLDRDPSGAGSEYGGMAPLSTFVQSPKVAGRGETPQTDSAESGLDDTSWLGKLQKVLTEGKHKPVQPLPQQWSSSSEANVPRRGAPRPDLRDQVTRSASIQQEKLIDEYATDQVSSSSDPDRATRSQSEQPGVRDMLSDGLKESLQDLVNAVHRTLGENQAGAGGGGSLHIPVASPPRITGMPMAGGSACLPIGTSKGSSMPLRSNSPVSRFAREVAFDKLASETGAGLRDNVDLMTKTLPSSRHIEEAMSESRTASPTARAGGRRSLEGDPRLEMTDSVLVGGQRNSLSRSQGRSPGPVPVSQTRSIPSQRTVSEAPLLSPQVSVFTREPTPGGSHVASALNAATSRLVSDPLSRSSNASVMRPGQPQVLRR